MTQPTPAPTLLQAAQPALTVAARRVPLLRPLLPTSEDGWTAEADGNVTRFVRTLNGDAPTSTPLHADLCASGPHQFVLHLSVPGSSATATLMVNGDHTRLDTRLGEQPAEPTLVADLLHGRWPAGSAGPWAGSELALLLHLNDWRAAQPYTDLPFLPHGGWTLTAQDGGGRPTLTLRRGLLRLTLTGAAPSSQGAHWPEAGRPLCARLSQSRPGVLGARPAPLYALVQDTPVIVDDTPTPHTRLIWSRLMHPHYGAPALQDRVGAVLRATHHKQLTRLAGALPAVLVQDPATPGTTPTLVIAGTGGSLHLRRPGAQGAPPALLNQLLPDAERYELSVQQPGQPDIPLARDGEAVNPGALPLLARLFPVPEGDA